MRTVAALTLVLCLASELPSQTVQADYRDRQLAGIKRVFLALPTDRSSVDTVSVRIAAELELRRVGIVPLRSLVSSDATVGIHIIPTPSKQAVVVMITVFQDATLSRDTKIVGIATWSSRLGLAASSSSEIDRTVEELLRPALAEFANSY